MFSNNIKRNDALSRFIIVSTICLGSNAFVWFLDFGSLDIRMVMFETVGQLEYVQDGQATAFKAAG